MLDDAVGQRQNEAARYVDAGSSRLHDIQLPPNFIQDIDVGVGPLRGRGMGTAVMDAAEAEARRHACVGVHLETTDYQALPFYEKRGYRVFGVLEGYPVGSRSYYLRKDL